MTTGMSTQESAIRGQHRNAQGMTYAEMELGDLCLELGRQAEALLKYNQQYAVLDKCQKALPDLLTVAEAGCLGYLMHHADIMRGCTEPMVLWLQRRFEWLRDGGDPDDPFWDE